MVSIAHSVMMLVKLVQILEIPSALIVKMDFINMIINNVKSVYLILLLFLYLINYVFHVIKLVQDALEIILINVRNVMELKK